MLLKYVFANDLKRFIEILQFINQIHRWNNTRHSEFHKRYATLSQWIVFVLPIFAYSIAIIYQSTCILNTLMTGVFRPPALITFPHVHNFGQIELLLLSIMNIICLEIALVLLSLVDTLTALAFINVMMLSNIFVHEVNELENVIKASCFKSTEIKDKLTQLILLYKKYNE